MVDVLPTFLAIADPAPPTSRDGRRIVPSDCSKASHGKRKGPLFFQYMDNRAIRTAEWTLAEVDGAGWELFDAIKDPLETKDVAAAKPEILAGLDARWLKWWKEQSGETSYQPESTSDGPHYKPQGDRGSGKPYVPRAMPAELAGRYRLPVPANKR